MTDVVIAQKAPYAIDVEAGKSYFWCACGRSANQPFCDGAHQGTDILPVKHTAEADKTLYFCGCKKTEKAPLCDCLLYTSPSPRDYAASRMPSSA